MEDTNADGPGARARGGPSGPDAARWIEDDGLLRDEGALYGLAGADDLLRDKVETIRAYFDAGIARSAVERESLLEERRRLEDRTREMQERIDAAEEREAAIEARHGRLNDGGDARGPEHADTSPGGLIRYGIGTVLAIGVSVLAYFIVREVLGDGFARPQLVALGVTLAGMFVVFAPVSLMYGTDAAQGERPWATDLWKARIVEIGLPVAAALFIVAWGDAGGALRAASAFLFLALLFLAGGKLLLSLLTRTGAEARRWRDQRSVRSERRALRDRADALEDRLATILQRLRATPTAEELEALRDHRITLLRSEFELARAAQAGRAAPIEHAAPDASDAGDAAPAVTAQDGEEDVA